MPAGPSLDHLIRPLQERLGDRQAEDLGGLEVDHEINMGRRPANQVRRGSRTCATAATKSVTLMGLLWYPSDPAAMIFCRSSLMTDAVMAITAIPRVASSARSRRSASTPSIPGSRISPRTNLGLRSLASRVPSSPVSASMVVYPLNVSTSRTSFRFLSLSSTIKISSPAMGSLEV